MPTFTGYLETGRDALLIIQACRLHYLNPCTHRLSEQERKNLKSGDIYCYNEESARIKRWTDGKSWGPSKQRNEYLVYKETDPNGLFKKSVTVKINDEFWHVIGYWDEQDLQFSRLDSVSSNQLLSRLELPNCQYITNSRKGRPRFSSSEPESDSAHDPSILIATVAHESYWDTVPVEQLITSFPGDYFFFRSQEQ